MTFTEPGEPGVYRRVPEVIDCWFDSGSMPFAQWGYPRTGHRRVRRDIPGGLHRRGDRSDARLVLLDADDLDARLRESRFPHPYKTCIVLGHVNDKEGKKESKSKGNYTPPEVILERVAMDFAAISGKDAGVESSAGNRAHRARGSRRARSQSGRQGESLRAPLIRDHVVELTVEPAKGLPRRVAVLPDDVVARLGVALSPRGVDLLPADVPRLPPEERVTIEDPATPAPGADAFRWFFLASNPPWNNKRHSLGNVRALQKEFPIKLRNVYSFFTIYASIDDFDPATREGRVRSRSGRFSIDGSFPSSLLSTASSSRTSTRIRRTMPRARSRTSWMRFRTGTCGAPASGSGSRSGTRTSSTPTRRSTSASRPSHSSPRLSCPS